MLLKQPRGERAAMMLSSTARRAGYFHDASDASVMTTTSRATPARWRATSRRGGPLGAGGRLQRAAARDGEADIYEAPRRARCASGSNAEP